jgi:SAM-dependent methyltransferase
MPEHLQDATERVIRDFGRQWTTYTDNQGYYGSLDLFRDIVGPLLPLAEFSGKRIADIGSGTGRIVGMLCQAGAAHVTAVEPSDAFKVLQANVGPLGDRVTCLHTTGDRLPGDDEFDMVVSIGVLHHIPDPGPAVRAAYRALRPGGKMLIWLYGREGTRLYRGFLFPLRVVTTRVPQAFTAALARVVDAALLAPYIAACKVFPLPLRAYMLDTLAKLTPEKRRLTILDQLQPTWAKYYTRDEAERLLSDAGFIDVRLHHRGGYSWTAVGSKP